MNMNRTNTSVESFYANMKHFIKGSKNPIIWDFIAHMKEYQSGIDNVIVNMRFGNMSLKRPKKKKL